MGEGVFEQWSEGRGEESWTITDLPLGQDVARQTADASIRVLAELNNQAHTRERSREVERETHPDTDKRQCRGRKHCSVSRREQASARTRNTAAGTHHADGDNVVRVLNNDLRRKVEGINGLQNFERSVHIVLAAAQHMSREW